jgi:hypothetical protein
MYQVTIVEGTARHIRLNEVAVFGAFDIEFRQLEQRNDVRMLAPLHGIDLAVAAHCRAADPKHLQGYLFVITCRG